MLDYIIVGQGLAGSFLADKLRKLNKKLIIFDKYVNNASSNIASGIANPVTGRKMVKTWQAEIVFPYSYSQYEELEMRFGKKFTSKNKIIKIFASIDDQLVWLKKQDIDEYTGFLGAIQNVENKHLQQPYSAAEILQAYWADIPQLMREFRNDFINKHLLLDEEFQFQYLNVAEDKIYYKDLEAKRIVFCEGYKVIHNPFFSYLPFTTAKGDLLHVYAPDFKLTEVITKGIHVVPLGNDVYLIGSTFIWNDLSDEVTQQGKEELIEKFEKIYSGKYEIIHEIAGVRPTIKDRRPVVGAHPKHKNMFIFNGLGTKGVTLSAYFAQQLIDHIELGKNIENEANIQRFINYYN